MFRCVNGLIYECLDGNLLQFIRDVKANLIACDKYDAHAVFNDLSFSINKDSFVDDIVLKCHLLRRIKQLEKAAFTSCFQN